MRAAPLTEMVLEVFFNGLLIYLLTPEIVGRHRSKY
jgi:hypothetical protein